MIALLFPPCSTHQFQTNTQQHCFLMNTTSSFHPIFLLRNPHAIKRTQRRQHAASHPRRSRSFRWRKQPQRRVRRRDLLQVIQHSLRKVCASSRPSFLTSRQRHAARQQNVREKIFPKLQIARHDRVEDVARHAERFLTDVLRTEQRLATLPTLRSQLQHVSVGQNVVNRRSLQ